MSAQAERLAERQQVNCQDVVDYIILKLNDGGVSLNVLKLQKLLYYVQAWNLAFYGRPLFRGRFQAWVHGPVNRELYDRLKNTHSLYSEVEREDIRPGFNPQSLDPASRLHIDTILESFANFTGSQLEEMTHKEEPWIRARDGYAPADRCEVELDENLMASFYGQLLKRTA